MKRSSRRINRILPVLLGVSMMFSVNPAYDYNHGEYAYGGVDDIKYALDKPGMGSAGLCVKENDAYSPEDFRHEHYLSEGEEITVRIKNDYRHSIDYSIFFNNRMYTNKESRS